jgi:cytidine deaminase
MDDLHELRDLRDLPASARELYDAAVVAMANSYSPYSNYPVGAAIRTSTGRVFAGCNVENAAYPLGSCAEAGAIAAMVFAGERQIIEVVTVTGGERPGTPCGGCRQRLREFAAASVAVYSTTVDADGPGDGAGGGSAGGGPVGGGPVGGGAVIARTIAELLPESFGPEFLDIRPT